MRQHHLDTTPFSRRCLLGLAALLASLLPAIPAQATQAVSTPTRTTLGISRFDSSSTAGATFTATVQTAASSPVNAGTVDFLLPTGQSLGSAIVAGDGTATLIVTRLSPTPEGPTGNVPGVTAVYHAGGTNAFEDSKSITAAFAAPSATAPVAPDFTVTGNPTTVTTAQGAYGSTALTISSVGGFTGAMQFSCSTLPTGVTCTFNPTQQVLAANGSFVSTLQLNTQSSEGIQAASLPAHTGLALALAVPGALALLAGGRRRKNMQLLAVLLLAGGASLGLSGCSQRYAYLKHPPPVAGGTAAGTYPIVVAVDGSQGSSVVEHDITISLVVQ